MPFDPFDERLYEAAFVGRDKLPHFLDVTRKHLESGINPYSDENYQKLYDEVFAQDSDYNEYADNFDREEAHTQLDRVHDEHEKSAVAAFLQTPEGAKIAGYVYNDPQRIREILQWKKTSEGICNNYREELEAKDRYWKERVSRHQHDIYREVADAYDSRHGRDIIANFVFKMWNKLA